ncbi:hypothetical protein N7488_002306 [Penicillium malachiteum]|nr:hypothetical protein N7488_002306 [Penicillium malachiteum]
MAYQFFSKPKSRSSSASPSPYRPARSDNPPIHLPPLQPPVGAKPGSCNVSEDTFPPFPHEIPAGYATAHPNITVETVKTAHIPSLSRITGLLLPIRYPTSFYTATITDPVIASLSRVAVYHDHPVAEISDRGSLPGTDKVIGGIRCRLEKHNSGPVVNGREATTLYIQTLHLLSPYRGSGVATSLLNSLLFESVDNKSTEKVSELVKHYNIREVTAHVHEANEDGLNWYTARGFKLDHTIVEGYYRRLKPSGARIVRLKVQWQDEETEGGQALEDPAQAPVEPNEAPAQHPSPNDADDEDWEKVEAEDDGDLGVQTLGESPNLERDEKEETATRKRKAEDESGNRAQRRL